MFNPRLAMKRSQSECLPLQGKIISPSPIKQSSRLSLRLASEIFDMSSSLPNPETQVGNLSPMKPLRVRFCSAKIDNASTNDWNSDSSYTVSSQGDCESPNAQNTKNPYHQDHIFEDITPDIPMRASNPIIKDVNFKQFDEEPFDSVLQEKLFSRFNVYKF